MKDRSDMETHYLNLEELHACLLSMLVRFDEFCRAHDLVYSVHAGTLLGTIRHQGFIPWDDDVDVSMSRPEFERFAAMADLFHQETGLRAGGHPRVPLEIAPLIKIYDDRIAVHPELEARETSLWIDLNPVDAMPESAEELKELCHKEHQLRAALSVVLNTVKSGKTRFRRFVKALCVPLRPFASYRRFVARRLTNNAKALPYGSTAYVGVVSWGYAEERERVHYADYEQHVEREFCDHKMMVMGCWDEYLRGIYGRNYMKLPPEDRRAVHLSRAWYVDDADRPSQDAGQQEEL